MKENSYSISSFFLKINQIIWKHAFLQKARVIFYFLDRILLVGLKQVEPDKKNKKKKVLLIYNMALGDGIMFLGVAEHFRKIYMKSEYELTIACQRAFSDLYLESGIFDKVIPCDFAGSVLNMKNRRALFAVIRKQAYDIIVDPVGCDNCTMNIFVTRAAIGKKKIGVVDKSLPHIQCPKWIRKKIYTDVIEIHKPQLHLIEFYAEFIRELGDKTCVAKPAAFGHIELGLDIPNKFFIIFPAASMQVKRWPLDRFAYIATKIQQKTGMPLVLCGTSHDWSVLEEFLKLIPNVQTVNLVGKTNIMRFIELIGRADLVVTNDTSAYHIAVAQKRKTALICGGYTYTRYANYHYSQQGYPDPVLITNPMKCFDCNNYCQYNNREIFPCIEEISKEKAWLEIEKMIELQK